MNVVSPPPLAARNQDALIRFLRDCKEQACRDHHYKVASISLEIKHIDPLAVLDSIYEENELHFYMENGVHEEAIAGADAIVSASFEGPGRFNAVKKFTQSILENSIATGDLEIPFSGPHFFCAFTFYNESSEEGCFAPATVFVPRWQVSRCGGKYGAVANILIDEESDLKIIADRIWKAHHKFSSFNYDTGRKILKADGSSESTISEVGGEGCYEKAVRIALDKIGAGDYDKIVLARALDMKRSNPVDPLASLNKLRRIYSDCYVFSIANGEKQSFIGASPERLLKIQGQELKTEAIAGSAPRGQTASEDAVLAQALLNCEKDLREHKLVIDSIARRLLEIGVDAQIEPIPALLQLSNVQHLRSHISGEMPRDKHLTDILAVLHPTPAVGGTPREKAMLDIKKLEAFERGLYAGVVGWLNCRGDGEMVVAIRSALINGSSARLYAGNGIVQGSDPKMEKMETDLKLRALLETIH